MSTFGTKKIFPPRKAKNTLKIFMNTPYPRVLDGGRPPHHPKVKKFYALKMIYSSSEAF